MAFTDEQLERYGRHLILKEVGGAGQMALMNARVLVIGAGGLGAPMLMYLAAAGVGTIGIVDDDVVDLSNLQRQVIHQTANIGEPKIDSAARAIKAINPDVCVEGHELRLDETNVSGIISDYDIVADGCDNFKTRLLVSDTCVELGKTLVSAALGPYEGQLATFKPHTGDALPCYRCFMPEEPPEDMQRTCADQGILGAVAGVMGSMQALEVIKEILNIGESLAGKIMLMDALTTQSRLIGLPKDKNCAACAGV